MSKTVVITGTSTGFGKLTATTLAEAGYTVIAGMRNTTGASGHTLPFMVPYLASKFGVESITEGAQDELKQFGIDNVSIQPGVYPTEMNTGVKAGIHGDKPEIAQEYDPLASEQFNALGQGLFGKMETFQMNPQTIADGILKLIETPAGQRPLRLPLDAIAQGTDIEFINARADIRAKWLAKYME